MNLQLPEITVPIWVLAVCIWSVGTVIISIFRASKYPHEGWEEDRWMVFLWPIFMCGVLLYMAIKALFWLIDRFLFKWPFLISKLLTKKPQ